MIVYLILLLPLGQLGLTSILTKKVAVPPFVSEELSKSPSSSLIYSAVLLVITYLNLRLIFTVPLLGTTTGGVWRAFVTSWRLTRWRSLRVLGLVFVVTFLAGLAALILGALTLAPTIATDILAPATSPWLAAFGLSVWQIGMFVITAFTAMMRDWLDRLPEDHGPASAVVSYSEPSHVTARRQKLLWGLAAGLMVVALGVTAVLNHKTMVTLVDSEETEVLAHRGFIQAPRRMWSATDSRFVVMHDTNLQRLAGKNLNVKRPHPGRVDQDHRSGWRDGSQDPLARRVDPAVHSAQPAAASGNQAAWRRNP